MGIGITSGVFAVAPYVAFLSSVAALNVALPVIFILSALSAVVIALSYKMIKQNKKPKENSKTEIKELNKKLREEKNTPVPIREELEDEKAKLASKNKEKFSGLEKKVDRISEETSNFATKDEVEGLKKTISGLSAKLINSAATKDEVEEKLDMKFYAKGEERGWNATFDDIILPSNIKEDLRGICKSKSGGYLLNGKGGTGKTSICEAIANEIKSQFAVIRVSASSLCNIPNIDQVFEEARENTPCIIIMEEIDGIGLDRESGQNKNVESLTHLLNKLNKTFLEENIVIATTNHREHLDSALIRGGRLKCIEIPGLDKDDTRQKILQERLEKLKPNDIKILVQASKGFSMANLIGLIDNIKETITKEGEIKYLCTFCTKFKSEHNIKDRQNKKHRNSKTKNEDNKTPKLPSEEQMGLSVSSSLDDVSSQENIQQIQSQGARTQNCSG